MCFWVVSLVVGVKIVFRVGLVLLKQMLGSVDKLREVQGMYETMERLRNISPDTIREDMLVQEVGLSARHKPVTWTKPPFLSQRHELWVSLRSGLMFTSSVCLVFVWCAVVQIVMLPVTEALIERECNVQVRKWRESRGELTHQPGRRLHGTRAIYEYKRRAAAISSGGSFSFLGSSIPPPGPLRASSSLLSLPGFRRSKTPFQSHSKKGSFSGMSGMDGGPPQSPPAASSPSRASSQKPPIPPGVSPRAQSPQVQSPLVGNAAAPSRGPAQASEAAPARARSSTPPQTLLPSNTLSPSPKIVSEQITPTIPSPTAHNSPLLPSSGAKKEAAPTPDVTAGEEDGKKKKRNKDDKKKEKEDERKKLKEKREKEKAEKERLRKEKERQEREKRREKVGKRKDKGGGESEDKNGAAAARDLA